MTTITYNKLVRDFIPDIIKAQGNIPDIKILSSEDFSKALDKKLFEETQEYLSSGDVEELADIFQVIIAIINERGLTFDQFESIRKEKAREKGEFNNHIFLSCVKCTQEEEGI